MKETRTTIPDNVTTVRNAVTGATRGVGTRDSYESYPVRLSDGFIAVLVLPRGLTDDDKIRIGRQLNVITTDEQFKIELDTEDVLNRLGITPA